MRRRQSGQAIVLAALMIIAIIGAVGLGIDVGNAAAHQRQNQSAADGAALAAADRLANRQTQAQATSAGQTVANIMGVPTANLTLTYLDGNRNPTASSDSTIYVRAQVNEGVPTFFMRALGIGIANVSALAEVRFPKRCAICLLDSTASPEADMSAGGSINVTGGCLQVNSSANPGATNTSGGAGGVNAPCTNIVGTPLAPALINPAPVTGMPQVPDPLAGLPYPTPPPASPSPGVYPGDINTVLSPGVYTDWALGGLGNLYLQPGTYVITGAGVSVTSTGGIKNCPAAPCTQAGVPWGGAGSVTLSPGGVTIFFTCSSWPGAGTAAGPICGGPGTPCTLTTGANLDISSNGGLSITAPTSGTYQGVAIFFDRCNNALIRLTANGSSPVTGAVYAKSSSLQLTASGTASFNGLVITATTQLSSNASMNINYDPTQANQAVNASWLKWPLARLIT
jgi:Flp pilus assembly protein TadG